MAYINMLWTECLCLPKFMCWSYNLQNDHFWRWSLWEGNESRAFMNGISTLIKRDRRQILSLLHRRKQQESDHVQTRKRALTRDLISCHLDFGLLSLPELWQVSLCCLSHSVYGNFVIVAQTKTFLNAQIYPSF